MKKKSSLDWKSMRVVQVKVRAIEAGKNEKYTCLKVLKENQYWGKFWWWLSYLSIYLKKEWYWGKFGDGQTKRMSAASKINGYNVFI